MARHSVKQIVFSSTAAIYGLPRSVPMTEENPQVPINPYGRTKLMVEKMLKDFDEACGIRHVALRYFNAAGADPDGEIGEDHQPETHLIPLVLDAALGRKRGVTVFGEDYPTPDGTCLRDYIHVSDLAEAHVRALAALGSGAASTAYNVGTGAPQSVRAVIDTVSRVVGRPVPWTSGPRRPGDPAALYAASDRIQQALGWRPRFPDLETIVAHAWQWHRTHPRGYADRPPHLA
jgi:UDP-glucose-4-epimerase GalE